MAKEKNKQNCENGDGRILWEGVPNKISYVISDKIPPLVINVIWLAMLMTIYGGRIYLLGVVFMLLPIILCWLAAYVTYYRFKPSYKVVLYRITDTGLSIKDTVSGKNIESYDYADINEADIKVKMSFLNRITNSGDLIFSSVFVFIAVEKPYEKLQIIKKQMLIAKSVEKKEPSRIVNVQDEQWQTNKYIYKVNKDGFWVSVIRKDSIAPSFKLEGNKDISDLYVEGFTKLYCFRWEEIGQVIRNKNQLTICFGPDVCPNPDYEVSTIEDEEVIIESIFDKITEFRRTNNAKGNKFRIAEVIDNSLNELFAYNKSK